MRKVSIVGVSASGKSTLARELSKISGIPVVELDSLYWQKGWQPRPPDEFRALTLPRLQADRWIIDGNYSTVRADVWRQADTIIWLHIPFWRNLWSVTSRTLKRVFTREKLWADNRESLWAQFTKDSIIRWVWTTHGPYEERYRKAFREMSLRDDSPRHLTLRGRDQARIFLETVARRPDFSVPERLLAYPVRIQRNGEPEILVFRNAKTGLVEVISEFRQPGETLGGLARRALAFEGLGLDEGHPQRFATRSAVVRVTRPPEELAVAEGSERTMSALRAIGASPRLRPEFRFQHAYWAFVRYSPERISARLIDAEGVAQDATLFWMSIEKAAKTMTRTAKDFLPELQEAIAAARSVENLQKEAMVSAKTLTASSGESSPPEAGI